MSNIQNLLENAKSNMMNMMKNRKYFLAYIFIFSYIINCICFSISYKYNIR